MRRRVVPAAGAIAAEFVEASIFFAANRVHFAGKRSKQRRRMDYFAQQLINGIVLGSIYGLIAIGYTMVYGIIGMVNFAHCDVYMVGAFAGMIVLLMTTALGMCCER